MIVSPSILACDFSHLPEEVSKMEIAGAEFIHLDVMDAVFVPNKTFDASLVATVKTSAVKDTHLMIVNPIEHIEEYAKAGSDIITFHIEACESEKQIHACIELIHSLGVKAGLSIKPATPVEALDPFLAEIDLALVMSVEPGKGGQKFMESALDKLSYIKAAASKCNPDLLIEVDGGINDVTGRLCAEAGANVLVAGSYLYGHEDYATRLKGLMQL